MKKGATPKSRSKVETSTRIRTGKVVSPKTSEDSLHDMSSRTPKSRSSNTVRISARTPTVATVGRTRSPRSSSSLSQRNAGMSPISSSASPLFSPKSPHSRSNDSTLLQLQLENELLMTRAEAAERRSELLSTEVDRLNDCMLQTQRACEEAQVQVEQLRKQEAEARNELDNLDREYRDCAYHLKSLTEKNADLIKALQEESRTRAKIEAASKRLAAENETLRSRADKLNIEVARESTERKSSTSIVKDLQKETERLREELNSVRIDHKLLLEKKASGELQLQERIQSLDSQSRSYQDELAACKQRLAAIEHEGIEKDRANRELKTMLHEQGEKLKAVQDQVTINNDYTEKLEEEVKKKQERLSTAAENEKRLQLKIKHLEELGQSGENHVKEVVKRMDNEISQLRSELGKEQAESSRLTERLIHFERKAEDADRVIAELEKEVAAVWDAKERGSKSLLSNQDALLALQQEVDTLNDTLREQRSANKQVLKENRSIMFELRTLEERNASLLKMLGGEEERATESEKQIDVIRRENSELSSTLSLKEKEISDMSRTLTEAQGELAKVSMRMQAEANEAARLKTEVEALQYKVSVGSTTIEDLSSKLDKQTRAKEQMKKEKRELEEQVFSLKRKVAQLTAELETMADRQEHEEQSRPSRSFDYLKSARTSSPVFTRIETERIEPKFMNGSDIKPVRMGREEDANVSSIFSSPLRFSPPSRRERRSSEEGKPLGAVSSPEVQRFSRFLSDKEVLSSSSTRREGEGPRR